MFTTIESFISEYQMESAKTQQLLDTLTDESLKQTQADGYRPLGYIAWHLVHAERGMLYGTGLAFESAPLVSEPPAQADMIADAFRSTTENILSAVRTQLTDEKLQDVVPMFGQSWTISYTLYSYFKHEIHHRGQLTILMRQAGLPVIGAYGPSKEEWVAFGRPAPAI
ncbi:DinB family protein [Paenibacillus qinlingensis]|uniref:Damage-inducible protein DinB n=1 Tax=Paenibacillus qinlingensis TaxID=1837343 RepID=A0ABU1P3Y7_9BACL|nr:DinB family protein [Paenibacillus qinlingensis]MDR6554458.1 putative damage-inducible protein DinB [Paenibacillus qinlingensis]